MNKPQLDHPLHYVLPGDGPWLRRYFAIMAPFYDKLPPSVALEVTQLDRWFYSTKSIGFLAGLTCSAIACAIGLYFAGASWHLAIGLTIAIYFFCTTVAGVAWFTPDLTHDLKGRTRANWKRNAWWVSLLLLVLGYFGTLVGAVLRRFASSTLPFRWSQITDWALDGIRSTAPFAAAICLLILFTVATIQNLRKRRLEQQLRVAHAKAIADAHAGELVKAQSQATQAKLKVLQAQIKPHFLFNTLAAVQHWVDTQDPRAPVLLSLLTSFLRQSTDAMDRDLISLRSELALTETYLKIMQFRLGPKLTYEIQCSDEAANRQVPPALVLSLIENAIEHGIAPSLAGGHVSAKATIIDGRLNLFVDDDGVGIIEHYDENVGLSNTRARLAAHFGESFILDVKSHPDHLGTRSAVNAPLL